MSTRLARGAGTATAIGVAWVITWLSQVPIGSAASAGGTLRLAWRARPERIETCQPVGDEALASVPRHMRQSVICEGTNASYRLQVTLDGHVATERLVAAGGLRRDRPLYVFLEVDVPAGDVDVAVRFTRIEPAGGVPPPDGSAPAREQRLEAVPSVLVYAHRLRFAPRQVRLVTYDPRRSELVEIVP